MSSCRCAAVAVSFVLQPAVHTGIMLCLRGPSTKTPVVIPFFCCNPMFLQLSVCVCRLSLYAAAAPMTCQSDPCADENADCRPGTGTDDRTCACKLGYTGDALTAGGCSGGCSHTVRDCCRHSSVTRVYALYKHSDLAGDTALSCTFMHSTSTMILLQLLRECCT
jgi:hypothetical protein